MLCYPEGFVITRHLDSINCTGPESTLFRKVFRWNECEIMTKWVFVKMSGYDSSRIGLNESLNIVVANNTMFRLRATGA